MSLSLDLSEKATVAVSLDDGHGTVTAFGQHGWDASGYQGLVTFANDPDGQTVWILAAALGSATVHFFATGPVAASLDVQITVTGTPPPPLSDPSLIVAFGVPVPK